MKIIEIGNLNVGPGKQLTFRFTSLQKTLRNYKIFDILGCATSTTTIRK